MYLRKGCAEIFTDIGRLCQVNTRRDKLTPAFVKLLDDTTRWVKVAAYQSLGPFITLFASVESESPTEIPELTEFEKTFIERVKESPTLFGCGRNQFPRSSMLGSESTEDLTAICIQDDDDDEDDEKAKDEEDCVKDVVTTNNSSAETSFLRDDFTDILDDFTTANKNEVDVADSKNQENACTNHENNNEEVPACDSLLKSLHETASAFEEASKCNSQTTSVSVHAVRNQPGVHIRVEKETPEELGQICRSSSVLSHRPVSFSANAATDNKNGPSTSIVSGSGTDTSTPHFNTFQYWRIPLPDIELDIGMVEGKPASVHVRAKVEDPNSKLTYASEISVNLSSEASHASTVTASGDNKGQIDATENQPAKIENLQIQTISSSSILDNESDQSTKLESSLSNTTVSLVDGRLAEVHRGYMDLYNVASNSTNPVTDVATGNNTNGSGLDGFTFDFQLDNYDDDSDDQLSSSTFPFRDERKYTTAYKSDGVE